MEIMNAEIAAAPANVLLAGVVGTTGYGLAAPESDVGRLGLFAARTGKLLGLHPVEQSVVSSKPGVTWHEAGKCAAIALRVNPAITELMWLPDDLYATRTALGRTLIAIRISFLSRVHVRNACLGYATRRFRRLGNRGDGSVGAGTRRRTAKRARHLLSLLTRGLGLDETGSLTARLDDPGHDREFGGRVAAGDIAAARREVTSAGRWFDEADSALPGKPDGRAVGFWLQMVRREYCAAAS
jgi:uncharacterized protein